MTLILSLVRHAKSSWNDPQLSDFERPLNVRGQRNAPDMAQRWLAKYPPPQRIVSSPAARALSTAQVFAHTLGVPSEQLHTDLRIYEAGLRRLLTILRELDPAAQDIALFGHNPGFSELLHTLLPESRDLLPADIPTCAVARLRLRGPRWADTAPGCAQLLDYDYPKRQD